MEERFLTPAGVRGAKRALRRLRSLLWWAGGMKKYEGLAEMG